MKFPRILVARAALAIFKGAAQGADVIMEPVPVAPAAPTDTTAYDWAGP